MIVRAAKLFSPVMSKFPNRPTYWPISISNTIKRKSLFSVPSISALYSCFSAGDEAYKIWSLSVVKESINNTKQHFNNDTLKFTSGLKIRNDRIWVLSSNIHYFITGLELDNGKNFRVLSGKINQLSKQTKCAVRETAPLSSNNYSRPSGYKPLLFQ